MTYLYHYYAMAKQNGSVAHADGVIEIDKKVLTAEDYAKIKELIVAKILNGYSSSANDIIVMSFSLIGERE